MKCSICGCENPDGYKYCHECGNPLIRPTYEETSDFDDFNNHQSFDDFNDFTSFDSKKLIIIGYIIAILFGWGSFLLSFLFGSFGFIGFVGLFFPGFMLNSKDSNIRRHAYIQLVIMLIGIIFTFYFIFMR